MLPRILARAGQWLGVDHLHEGQGVVYHPQPLHLPETHPVHGGL